MIDEKGYLKLSNLEIYTKNVKHEDDFKTDVCNLGYAFYYIIANTDINTKINSYYSMEMIFPSNGKNKYFPTNYSEELRNFIEKMIIHIEKRPSPIKAYSEAINCYIVKYFQITSIKCTLYCLSNIPLLLDYFKSDIIDKYIKNDEYNDNKKYIITKSLRDTLNKINSSFFSFDEINIACMKLVLILYTNEERIKATREIEVGKFISDLLIKTHKELNKYNKNRENGQNNINNEEENED